MNRYPTIYLVDDDDALREAITATLTLAGHEVRTYVSGEDFLAEIDPSAAGCILSDLMLPGMSGIELQQRLNAQQIQLPIIFMTGYGDIRESVQAIKAGALDFLEKPVSPAVLLRRIQDALQIDKSRRLQEHEQVNQNKRLNELSPREKEVAVMVAEGKTNKEIARDLNISYRTVEKHRASAMQKLEVDNIVELTKLIQANAIEKA